MKKSIVIASLALALANTHALAKPSHFKFSTYQFDYAIPQKLAELCRQRYNVLPDNERDDDEYCMRVEIDVVKTNYPFINDIINSAKIADVNIATSEGAKQARQAFDERANDVYAELQHKENTQFNLAYYSSVNKLFSTSPNVVQIRAEDYQYMGGPHGMPTMEFFVFDLAKQKRLAVDDILISPSKKSALKKLVFAQFREWVKQDYVENDEKFNEQDFAEHQKIWSFYLSNNFYFTPKGMIFGYNPYDIGPYAMGFAMLNVDKKALKGIVKDEYLNQTFERFDDNGWRR